MRFWDSSALVPLLVNEISTARVTVEYLADPDVVAWWGAEVECVSALCRSERAQALSSERLSDAMERLRSMLLSWRIVRPSTPVKATAVRLLRVHPLTAGDALQLAAALEASERRPDTLPFLTLDERLARAAEREGFPVGLPIV